MVIKRILISVILLMSFIIHLNSSERINSLSALVKQVNEERKSNNCFESNVLIIDFFIMEDENYLRLYFMPECVLERLVGYSLVDSFIVLYFGIEDDLANEYLSLIKSDFENIPCLSYSPQGTDIDLKEEDIRYYKIIDKNNFKEFIPDNSFLEKLDELFLRKNYLIEPPLPPI